MTMFVVTSLEDWDYIMYAAVDATGVEQGPKIDYRLRYSLYFMGVIMLSSYLLQNLYLGLLFLSYKESGRELDVIRNNKYKLNI